MEEHERQRSMRYNHVVRLRSDLRLPRPLELTPPAQTGLHGADGERALVMRGDWIFWGRREPMRVALQYVESLPRMHAIGQRHYLPLPWRHMLAVGADGLNAGLVGWLKFPKQSEALPFGFSGQAASSSFNIIKHVREHLTELEAFEGSRAARQLRPSDLISVRDGWWRWNDIPDNEKYFFYHVLNSTLFPRANFIDLYNRGAPKDSQVSFLGRTNGLLIPEGIRHDRNCTCVCPMAG